MASNPSDEERLAELAEAPAGDGELERWLIEHPDLANDLAAVRQVRALIQALSAAEFEVPPGFEAQVLAQVQQDAILRNLIDLGVNGVGALLIEVLGLFFGLVPKARAAATP